MPEYQNSWDMSATMLNKLWFEAYSRIVAHMWRRGESHKFTTFFRDSEAFRRAQFERMGVEIHPHFRIYIDEQVGATDIILGNLGVILPLPTKPRIKHIFNMYQIRPPGRLGWRLPNLQLDLHIHSINLLNNTGGDGAAATEQHDPDTDFFAKKEINEQTFLKNNVNPPERKTWTWYMSGNQYRDLLLALPKLIVYGWEDNDFYEDFYVGDPKRALLDSDVQLPPGVEVDVHDDRTISECSISNVGFTLPFPQRPFKREFFNAWARGEAGIPTFTNSKT